jgi:diguanylate cyclase (GGDEF)-like protein/PAS domain S-box-containing protein
VAAERNRTEDCKYQQKSKTKTSKETCKQCDAVTAKDENLSLSEERFRLAIDSSDQGIWDLDVQARTYIISQHWANKFGMPASGADWDEFLRRAHPDELDDRNRRILALFSGETPNFEMEYRVRDAAGNWVWVLSKGKAIFDENKKPVRFIGSFTDVTEIRRREAEREYEANHDELTGLFNRRGFFKAVEQQMTNPANNRKAYVVLLDVDDFKMVNDTLGHTAGDAVLQQISIHVARALGDNCIFARHGGDEFIAFFWGESNAGIRTKENVECIDSFLVETGSGAKYYSISRGLAIFPDHGVTIEELTRKADIALNEAKRSGKTRCVVYSEEIEAKTIRVAKIQECLYTALANEELWLVFQPVFNMRSKKLQGFEALLRWNNPILGSISPAEFIPVAEQMGTIVPIGEWVLQEVCRFGRRIFEETGEWPRVGINISARQLTHSRFSANVGHNVAKYDVPNGKLVLEVTESVFIDNMVDCSARLNDLRQKYGIQIALDDFGTGYSSLNYLKDLPLDILKIDKKFIDTITLDKESKGQKLLRAIFRIADELGLLAISEGVERQEQFDFLLANGSHLCQGYFLSYPLKEEEALNLLR